MGKGKNVQREAQDHHIVNSNPQYPEPSRTSLNPYPVVANSAYPSFPGSAYGTFPGSYGSNVSLPESRANNRFDNSRSDESPPGPAQTLTSRPVNEAGESNARRADRARALDDGDDDSDAESPSQTRSEAQTIAQQFHTEYGDPGESLSSLAGLYYNDDVGGAVAARRAWEAAYTYGGQFEWVEDYDDGQPDPEVEALLAEEGVVPEQSAPRGPKRRRNKGRGGWRRLLKGTDHEDVGRTKTSTRGRGVSRSTGTVRRGRHKAIDPGRDFKMFLAEANKAYLADDFLEAADFARQAIQANPEVYQAHALLSTTLERLDRPVDAAQSMKVGAHTARSPEVWLQVADKILELADESGFSNLYTEATECYSEALKLYSAIKQNPEIELIIRSRALTIYEKLNDVRNCRFQCRLILKNHPMKTEYVQRYAMLCAKWQDTMEIAKAKECYEKAFELYQDEQEFGDEDDPTDKWSHLNIYLEIHDMIGKPVDGIVACKRLARWFLGRKEETFWENHVLDDCEFDFDNSRRNFIAEFQQGRASRDLSKYGDGLPIDIRVRLGLFRIKMGPDYYDEALRHFSPLLSYADDIDNYDDVFLLVAGALRGCGKHQEAAKYYDVARTKTNADDPEYGLGEADWLWMALCYQFLGRTEDAISSFENVRRRKGEHYARACVRLAKLYEDRDEIEQARSLCGELIMLNRRDMLLESQVKMVPMLLKSKKWLSQHQPIQPPGPSLAPTSHLAASPARPLQMKQSFPDRTTTDAYSPASLGPLSRPIVIPSNPVDAHEAPKKKRPRSKKRGILLTVPNETEEATTAEANEPDLKRPRLKRKYARKSSAVDEQERIRRLQDTQTRTMENYAIVQAYWSELHKGIDFEAIEQWTEAANAMLEEIKAMKVFFPDRDLNVKLKVTDNGAKPFLKDFRGKDLEQDGPKKFLGIAFRDWQHVFVDLALFYVKTGEQDRCYKVVQEVLGSANIFYLDPDLNLISYATAIYVGLAFNDSQYLIQLARQIISSKPTDFRNSMGFQIFAAVARFSFGSNWFFSGPSQKFMLRMVKQADFMAMTDDLRKQIDWSGQGPGLGARAENYGKEDMPDAHMITMYGHMVAAANHSFSALPYYYRALALQPDNICVNLSIATMWIQYSMKRQVDNRQEGITNGLSFLYRYYDLRVASGKAADIQEAEYNVARMWHYLGLTHLAVPGYEKVLDLSERVQVEKSDHECPPECDPEDFAAEAAYALQNLYCLVGNDEAARVITERWLVI